MEIQNKIDELKDRLPSFAESFSTALNPEYISTPQGSGYSVPNLSGIFESVYKLIRSIHDKETEQLEPSARAAKSKS